LRKCGGSIDYHVLRKHENRAFPASFQKCPVVWSKHIIIDGHLVFAKGENEFENVMTEKDKIFYTDYIYLNLPTESILQRQQNDRDKKRNHSAKTITNWVAFELQELKQFCDNNSLNLRILETTDNKECVEFICNYITI
jgi:hypothetical protein